MSKAHLVTSDIPLVEGITLVAGCGKSVPCAYFVFWGNGDYVELGLDWGKICHKCVTSNRRRMYIYGIIEGQAAKDAERQGESLAEMVERVMNK